MAKLLVDYEVQCIREGRLHTIRLQGGSYDGVRPDDIPAPPLALLFRHEKVLLREIEVVDGSFSTGLFFTSRRGHRV